MKNIYKLFLILILTGFVYTNAKSQKTEQFYKENASGWVDLMQSPDGNVYEAKKAFDLYWSNQDLTKLNATKGRGYKPFIRWYEHMAPRVYPTGEKPSSDVAYHEYKKFTNSFPDNTKASNWTFLGPTNPGGYVYNGSYQSPGGSGRINAIAFDPNNSNIIWVGTPAGGLWKSTNGGSSWTIISDQFNVMGISAIAIDYNNPNIMYIGTGDRDAGDTYSIGVLKSTDGGATWNTTSVSFSESQGARCTDILMHPTNPNILFASFNGLVYKTTDGFATKTSVLSKVIFDMEFKPGDPNTVYASGNEFFKSTNGGSSFTAVTSGIPTSGVQRIEIAVSPNASAKVWLLVGQSSDQGMEGVYRSTNSGGSFTKIYSNSSGNLLGWDPTPSNNIGDGGQAFYDLSFAVNPNNENEMFIGGVNLYKSTNGGTSWSCSAYWLDGSSYEYAHADYHAIEYLNSSTLFVGNDGGIFKSSNNGSTWTDLSNNLGIAQVARFGISASDPNIIMTGMQDNGTNKYNGTTWSIVYGGDGCETAVDPTNTSVVYCSYVYGDIKRSTNGGSSWTSIKPVSSSGAWITPFVIDPNSNTTLYAGFADIYKSTDRGSSWSKIGSTPGSGNVINIAVAQSNSSYIYFIKQYSSSYTVGKTSNGGSSWESIGSGLPLSSAAPTYIAVSQNDPNTLWVTFSGYEAGKKVYKSTNGGSSWTNVSGNLPNLPANAIVYQNNTDDLLYVGCDVGVYYKDNSSTNWNLYSTNLPNTVINELEIYYDDVTPSNSKLRAATYGRSVWETPLATSGDVCNIPSGLAAINVTSTSARLTWTTVDGAVSYDVQYKAVSSGTWNTYNTTNLYYDISGLSTDDTQYEFQVKTNCSSGGSQYSASEYFGYTPVTYCESVSNSVNDEWINRVVCGDIDNTSGSNGGYGDFTAMSTDLPKGGTQEITIYPAWAGQQYEEGYAVWIDFNQDGDFTDSGEQVFTKDKSTAASANGVMNIPSGALTGPTVMRVIMQYNQIPASSCGSYNYGETEDYTVNIIDAGDTQAPTAPTSLSSSNITPNSVDLNWTASTDNVGVTGYKVYKNGALVAETASTSYTASGLTPETEYSFYVKAFDAAGNISSASNTIYATTIAEPDTQAPSAPSSLAYANLTQISVDLSWSASTDNVGVTGYRIYMNNSYRTTVTGTSYTANGLSASTSYQFYVIATDAAGNYSSQSNTVSFTTPSNGLSYCASKGNSVNDEWIEQVVCEDINNTSGANGGYADFTSFSTPLYKGNTASITIKPGWSGTVYAEAYAVWIDYNQDGDFEDAGELVFSQDKTTNTPINGNFTVSAGATNGDTRMRVSMKYNGIPSPCETFDYGEVEDYTVNIQDGGDMQAPSNPTNLSTSNITQTSVQLSWTASTDNVGVSGYKIYKNGAYLISTTGTSYTVNSLTASTSYSFYVTAYDAATNESGASNTVNATTLDTPDTQAPTAPSSLAASNITTNSLILNWSASNDNVAVTGYKVYKNGALLASTAGTSYSVTSLASGTSYSFYVKAYDAAGNLSAASNTINPTTLSSGLSYCESRGQSVSDEWLNRVVVGSIDNTSGANGGYADFTSMSTSFGQGSSQNITMYPAWNGTVYAEGYAVWIDYNQDGDFEDAGEMVFSQAATKDVSVSGSFTVPASAPTGNTRMRVSMKYNGIPTPCETFNYGEVEDYTVTIIAENDTQAPSAPTSLSSSNITISSVTLSWTASTDNVAVTGYNIYKNGALLGNVSSTSANVTGLAEATLYSFYVKAYDAAGNISAASNTINVTTATNSVTYCDSKGNTVTDEWIQRVVVGSIDNNSGVNGGYADFTAMSTTMSRNSQYNITVYPAWSGTIYDEGYAVWIDYNRDGDFEDAGELVFSNPKTKNTSVSGSFTIPGTALIGTTRMRVTMQYNQIPASCGNFNYGEVEDYTINITAAKQSESFSTPLVVYPNPARETITLDISGVSDYSKVEIYSLTGAKMKENFVNEFNNEINISNLNPGTYYIRLITNEGVKTTKFIKQ